MEDFVTYQKSLFIDMAYLQQDAFDDVDASTTLERQKKSFEMVRDIVRADYTFKDKEVARDYFTRLTGLYKNYNYARENSPDHEKYLKQITELVGSALPLANE